jgi:hypothetical protein
MNWEEKATALRTRWLDRAQSELADWRQPGVVIEGDFAGIQRYVLRPVPGVGGAAKRLRGRSARVVALTELIAESARHAVPEGRLLYTAGGRFLVYGRLSEGWQEHVSQLQVRLDKWFFREFHGEVAFRLAAAPYEGDRIPRERLRTAMGERRGRPLEWALTNNGRWETAIFHQPASEEADICPSCLETAEALPDWSQGKVVCLQCRRDEEVGAGLSRVKRPGLTPEPDGPVRLFESGYEVGEFGERPEGYTLPLIHW